MKVLFICSANKQRSKTAEDYFAAQFPQREFKSAGTNLKLCRQEGTTPLTLELLEWADDIYVMEERHRKAIKEYFNPAYHSKITVLGIPDRFKYYDRDLIELLNQKIKLSQTDIIR